MNFNLEQEDATARRLESVIVRYERERHSSKGQAVARATTPASLTLHSLSSTVCRQGQCCARAITPLSVTPAQHDTRIVCMLGQPFAKAIMATSVGLSQWARSMDFSPEQALASATNPESLIFSQYDKST